MQHADVIGSITAIILASCVYLILQSHFLNLRSRFFLIGHIIGISIWATSIHYLLGFQGLNILPSTFLYGIVQFLFIGAGINFIYFILLLYSIGNAMLTVKSILPALLLFVYTLVIALIPEQVFQSILVQESSFLVSRGEYTYLVSVFIGICIVLIIRELVQRLRNEENLNRIYQLKIISAGILLFAFLATFSNWVLPVYFNVPDLNGIGPIFFLFEAGLTTWVLVNPYLPPPKEILVKCTYLTLLFIVALYCHPIVLLLSVFVNKIETRNVTSKDLNRIIISNVHSLYPEIRSKNKRLYNKDIRYMNAQKNVIFEQGNIINNKDLIPPSNYNPLKELKEFSMLRECHFSCSIKSMSSIGIGLNYIVFLICKILSNSELESLRLEVNVDFITLKIEFLTDSNHRIFMCFLSMASFFKGSKNIEIHKDLRMIDIKFGLV